MINKLGVVEMNEITEEQLITGVLNKLKEKSNDIEILSQSINYLTTRSHDGKIELNIEIDESSSFFTKKRLIKITIFNYETKRSSQASTYNREIVKEFKLLFENLNEEAKQKKLEESKVALDNFFKN